MKTVFSYILAISVWCFAAVAMLRLFALLSVEYARKFHWETDFSIRLVMFIMHAAIAAAAIYGAAQMDKRK